MGRTEIESKDNIISSLFLIVPTILLITGWFTGNYIYNSSIENISRSLILIPLFSGLIFLGLGFFLKKIQIANKTKMTGWIIFAFYWSMQPYILYFGEDGDIFNATASIIGVYVLFYIAYHEWGSIKRKESLNCLNWAAGTAAIAGFIYFTIENTPLSDWLREVVAAHSGWLLNLVFGGVEVYGINIYYHGVFAVHIIFACTAVQAMVFFVGMILPLPNVNLKRKIYGLLVTVVPIYFLNLGRNALIAYLLAEDITSFFMAHNVIGKTGSLIVMIILLLVIIKILPEVFDELISLIDLYKRDGSLEKGIRNILRRNK